MRVRHWRLPQAVRPGDQPGSRLLAGAAAVALSAGMIAAFLPELRGVLRSAPDAQTQRTGALPQRPGQDTSSPCSGLEPLPPTVGMHPPEPAESKGTLTAVPNLSSEGMEVDLGPDGQVLAWPSAGQPRCARWGSGSSRAESPAGIMGRAHDIPEGVTR